MLRTYFCYFLCHPESIWSGKRDVGRGEVTLTRLTKEEKTKFHVIRKVYSQVIYTFLYDSAMWFLCFSVKLAGWMMTKGRGVFMEWSLLRSMYRINFFLRCSLLMNNLMNQIFTFSGPNSEKTKPKRNANNTQKLLLHRRFSCAP